MALYTFYQNNSGGYFEGPKKIVVRAVSPEIANKIAEKQFGIYFDGVDRGIDCDCCGDRWNRVTHSDDLLM